MTTIIRIILICFIIFPCNINGERRRCMNTGVLFTDKIIHSPIIVYGEPLAKEIYVDTDMELLFNVTFRVDCIFKGQEDIVNRINITEAGIKMNRSACQWLDPGKFYVVFLEKCESNMNVYCPLDFQERIVDDMTYELLEKTCHLTRIPSLHSTSNNCPNVSMTEFCPNDEIDVKIIPKQKQTEYVQPNIRTSFNNANQFYVQSNGTISNDKPLVARIADNPHGHASLSACISLWILIIAVGATIFF
ncbi:unnamed protein product [Adineta steineri]|uniref:Uncharacterized protein n=1 Tax=Adineta steineri TaxID=433720 RepID=A0A815I1V6_9BILA|nr:unnamed protein product [Adineta steineri]CAF3842250.1 unnamed protein product [Adineta steineri]